MSFVNPALLWGLPLLAVPVLIHLLFRWRHRPVVFSDLALLRVAVAQVMPRRRLEEWLLVLVRCALVALLIAAFARPVLHGAAGSAPTEKESLDLVVLLDGSYSMSTLTLGRTRFERAKAVASGLLHSLRPQDRATVVLFSDRIEASSGELQAGAARLDEWLGRAVTGLHGTDYRLALETAYSLLSRSTAGRKAVVVLSDNARHGFRNLDPKSLSVGVPFYDPKVRLAGVGWDEPPVNTALEGAGLIGGELRAQAALYGAAAAPGDFTLFDGPRVGAKKRVTLKPGRNELSFGVSAATGAFAGRVSSRRDALGADDDWYFAFTVKEPPRVLVLEAARREMPAFTGGYFVKRAFESARLDVTPSYGDPGALTAENLRGARAVLLLSPSAVTSAGAAALEHWVRQGGGLWVVPDDAPDGLRQLAPFLPARLTRPEIKTSGLVPAAARAWPVPFAWDDFDLSRVEARRAYALQPREGGEAAFSDGRGVPLLVQGRLGRGRIFVSASPLQPAWTNLPLKPVFAPWLGAALGQLAAAEQLGLTQNLRLEDVYVRSWRPPETPPGAAVVTAPDGTSTRVPVSEGKIQFARTEAPGLYRVTAETAGGRLEGTFAVNLDPSKREGDLTRQGDPPWILLKEENFAQDFQRILFGVEARHWALLLILLLLVAEGLLSARPPTAPPPVHGRGPGGESSKKAVAALSLFLLLFLPLTSHAEGSRFTWAQLKLGQAWDPYPEAWTEISTYLGQTTSIPLEKDRRPIKLTDPALFTSPFLLLTGKEAPPELTEAETQILRRYLLNGGFLWVDDASGLKGSSFDRWARRELAKVLPETGFEVLSSTHAVFRSFYLLRSIGGRVLVQPSIEGIPLSNRTAVLYTRNDLAGAWMKDSLGNYLYPCTPGGEGQRFEARKLTVNIVLYALTGSYKLDAVHQPFILDKLRSYAQ